jgi:type VI protein secretion system component Hcp
MAKATQFLKLIDKHGETVEGECFNAKHLGEIDLTGWNWDVSDPAVPKPKGKDDDPSKAKTKSKNDSQGQGEDDTKPKPSKLSLTKTTDRSTMRLLSAMDKGEIFPTATLTLEEQYEGSPLPFFLEIELKDVFIVQFSWNASASGAGMTMDESWELNYSEIKFSYHWRGGQAGWIDQSFIRPPDATDGTSKKAPPSKAEKEASDEERFDAWAKKRGLHK